MKLLEVDTLSEARAKIWRCFEARPARVETLPLAEALGRVIAAELFCPEDIPAFSRSTVDGYAVLASDTAAAGEAIPALLALQGSVEMGKPAGLEIQSGQCVYVPTGGMLPCGADAVVMVEFCEPAGGGFIAVYEAASPLCGITLAGEDFARGQRLFAAGTVLRPQETGVLASAGILAVPVFAPLRLALISSGDELVAPEEQPPPGGIRDINTYSLAALASRRGFDVVSRRLIGDDEEALGSALREALATSDVVVISGGSSQGEKDLTAMLINRVARPGVFTHGLALKPGKPTILGWHEESATLLAGLPGHPAAALLVFELLLGALADTVTGRPRPRPIPARLAGNVPGGSGREVCQSVTLRFDGASYLAEPVFGKSGMMSILSRADGYILIDKNSEGLSPGTGVLVYLL